MISELLNRRSLKPAIREHRFDFVSCRLAHRCVKAGADVIAPTGRALTEASIGMALATRDLMDDLRSAGQTTGGPKPFQPRDRSNFLSALDLAIVRLKRDGFGA